MFLDRQTTLALDGYRTYANAVVDGTDHRLSSMIHDRAKRASDWLDLAWPPTLASLDEWADRTNPIADTGDGGYEAEARRRAENFWSYFNVADELAGGLTLDDLDPTHVDEARDAADVQNLSWPPSLAEAEEFALAHRTALDAAMADR